MLFVRSRVQSAALAAALLVTSTVFAQQKPAPARPAAPRPATPPKPTTAKPAPAPAPKPPEPQDVVIKTEYTAGDKTTTSTVSAKGNRQRIEFGAEMTVIADCDTGRRVQINDDHKRYLVSSPAAASQATKKGGVITYTTTVTDTGERKPLFGQTARHLTMVVVKEPSANACDKNKERVETDGWFIDRPAVLACAMLDSKPAAAATSSDCGDEIKYVQNGPAVSSAFPLSYTVTTTVDNKPSSVTMNVVSLEKATLPDSTFATPEGFTEVQKLADLTGGPTATSAKVGVLSMTNKTKDQVSLPALSDALGVSLQEAGLNVVQLQATTAAAAVTEARAKSLDYILITQVTDVAKPAKGLLGKVGGSKEYGAKVDYVLTSPGAAAARLSGAERSGTSTLQSTISMAKTVARYVTPFGILSSQFKFMNTFAGLTNGAQSSTMSQSSDPVINTIFSLVGSASEKPSSSSNESPQSEDAAVAFALEKIVSAVAGQLVTK